MDFYDSRYIQLLFYKYLNDNPNFYYEIKEDYSFEEFKKKVENKTFDIEYLKNAFDEVSLSAIGGKYEEIFIDLFDLDAFKPFNNTKIYSLIKDICHVSDTKEKLLMLISNVISTINPSTGKLIYSLLSNIKKPTNIRYNDNHPELICIDKVRCNSIIFEDTNLNKLFYDKISLIINNSETNVVKTINNNSIDNNIFENKLFDFQYIIPPFGMKKKDLKTGFQNIEYSYLIDEIEYMDIDGVAAFICTNKTLFPTNEKEKSFINELIKTNLIDTIIKVPEVMYGATVEINILILNKNKKNNKIYILDARAFYEKNKQEKIISNTNIEEIINLHDKKQERTNIAYYVKSDEILKDNLPIIPDKYILNNIYKKSIKKQKTTKLPELAEIYKIGKNVNTGKFLPKEACIYPFDINKIATGDISNFELKKGDIIFKNGLINSIYLIDEVLENVFAESNDIILRPIKIQSEYLFEFFKSSIIKNFIELKSCGYFIRIRVELLKQIDIILPEKDKKEYRKLFELSNYLKIDEKSYKTLIENKTKYIDDDFENTICIEEMSKIYNTAAQTSISKDIEELNICYNAGAYKAAIILAGSILEAVLIDWLSEMDGIDYFSTDYIITKPDGTTKRAELIDYIEAIKEIKKPDWMDEADKAHEIRQKRNCVHAKLFINERDINKHTCEKVIRYLKEVLITRGLTITED